jgi:hypothetical protein
MSGYQARRPVYRHGDECGLPLADRRDHLLREGLGEHVRLELEHTVQQPNEPEHDLKAAAGQESVK